MVLLTRVRHFLRSARPSHYLLKSSSTLAGSSHIHIFPTSDGTSHTKILSLLPTNPPNALLALGTTSEIPPTPQSFIENPGFLPLLNSVLTKHAVGDPQVQAQAKAYASQAGSALGGYPMFLSKQQENPVQQRKVASAKFGGGSAGGGSGAGGASRQGGMGGAGRGGWIHVSDQRNPPDFGRIAEPEDIFGSLNVDGKGNFVGSDGDYQSSGTYRIVTREGVLGLSLFLRKKVIERLEELEKTSGKPKDTTSAVGS